MTWEKGMRVAVAAGPHAGARGRLIRELGGGEWLVKFDHRFAGTAVAVKNLRVEQLHPYRAGHPNPGDHRW